MDIYNYLFEHLDVTLVLPVDINVIVGYIRLRCLVVMQTHNLKSWKEVGIFSSQCDYASMFSELGQLLHIAMTSITSNTSNSAKCWVLPSSAYTLCSYSAKDWSAGVLFTRNLARLDKFDIFIDMQWIVCVFLYYTGLIGTYFASFHL